MAGARERAEDRRVRARKRRRRDEEAAPFEADGGEVEEEVGEAVNPYAPPQTREPEEAPSRKRKKRRRLEDASTGKRFANMLIDTFIVWVINFVLGIGLVFGRPAGAELLLYAVGLTSSFLYYVVCEGLLLGRTVGKLVTGTKVVDEDGNPPTLGTVMLRTVCRWVPFEPFSCFGGRGWHDRWSGTHVVEVDPRR
jgi:uncharacterized RDD family membrane protein YckC